MENTEGVWADTWYMWGTSYVTALGEENLAAGTVSAETLRSGDVMSVWETSEECNSVSESRSMWNEITQVFRVHLCMALKAKISLESILSVLGKDWWLVGFRKDGDMMQFTFELVILITMQSEIKVGVRQGAEKPIRRWL